MHIHYHSSEDDSDSDDDDTLPSDERTLQSIYMLIVDTSYYVHYNIHV